MTLIEDFDSFLTSGTSGFGVSNTSQTQIDGFGWYNGASHDEAASDDEASDDKSSDDESSDDESKKRVAVFIESRRAQSDNAEQERNEVEGFMKYVVAQGLALFVLWCDNTIPRGIWAA